MDAAEFKDWVMRMLGSWEAYERSLPSRHWFQTLTGWASRPR